MNRQCLIRSLFAGCIVIFFVYILLLSWWTPFTADSFHHALFGCDHQLNLPAVWEKYCWSYANWNPRLGEGMAYLIATCGKTTFILLNPCVVIALIFCMFFLICGYKPRFSSGRDLLLFVLCGLMLFCFSSRPGITIFWLSGSTNYAWSACIWLAFLCCYRALWAGTPLFTDKLHNSIWLALFAFLTGMTNENQVPATLAILAIYWCYARKQKISLPKWFYTGFIAFIAGGLCLLLAPGNAQRMHTPAGSVVQVLSNWQERMAALPELITALREFTFVPCFFFYGGLIILFFTTLIRGRHIWTSPERRRLYVSLLLFTVAHGMAISFAVRVIPAWHAMFSATVFILIATLIVYQIMFSLLPWRWIPISILGTIAVGAVWICGHYLRADRLIYQQCQERLTLIQQQIAQGRQHLVVPPYRPLEIPSWVSIMWRMESPDPDSFINRGISDYFKIKSIRVLAPDEQPK